MTNLYLGCPVWSHKGWIGSLYPQGTRQADFLREYARRLTTVEGNTTFYAIPNEEKLAHWIEETPETFRFCPKVPRTISHAGEVAPHIEEAHAFIQAMRPLGPRLGPMFLQLPPRYPPANWKDLREFLSAWPAQVPLAVEVRHSAWFAPAIQEKLVDLLQELGKALVVNDARPIASLRGNALLEGSVYKNMLEIQMRKRDQSISPHPELPFTFIRFVGHPVMEQNIEFMEAWAGPLAEQIQNGREAYVFCHCPDVRLDPWLCHEFYKRVSAKTPIPPLPWNALDASSTGQPSLL